MTVAKFIQPDMTAQMGNTYKGNLDAAAAVFARSGAVFAPHEQSTPNMTVRLDAGYIFAGGVLTEVAAQNSATITAPSTNPRIDRIVVDLLTGAVSVVTGVQGASPSAPAIPAGKAPVARVLLQTSSTAITNSMLTDERAGGTPLADFLTPWTPTLTTDSGTISSIGTAQYNQTGLLRVLIGQILVSSVSSSSGDLYIGNLPITSMTNEYGAGSVWVSGMLAAREQLQMTPDFVGGNHVLRIKASFDVGVAMRAGVKIGFTFIVP